MGRRLAQAAERGEPDRVGQPEVEQDAVEGLAAQEVEAPGERLRAPHVDGRDPLEQDPGDQEGVAGVVLDEQHAHEVARGRACERWFGRKRRGQVVFDADPAGAAYSELFSVSAGVGEPADIECLAFAAAGRHEPRRS